MSLYSAEAILADSLKQLHQRWARIGQRWDDPASRAIQKEFVEPLDPLVRSAIRAIGQVSAVMEKVRRECDDD